MKNDGQFKKLLKEAMTLHCHLCAGQIIGVRIAMLGLHELGIIDSKGKDRNKLIIFVEIDRCATDAIMTVTGCRIGKRKMKILDYGKMAATFINTEINRTVRIVSLQNTREKAAVIYPELNENAAQMKA